MATRTDVYTRALQRMGVVRPGSGVPGNLVTMADEALSDLLLELNEEVSLDFDPSVINEIPDERMPTLVNLFRYSPSLDSLDTKQSPSDRALLFEFNKNKFFNTIIGDSDYVESEPRNF